MHIWTLCSEHREVSEIEPLVTDLNSNKFFHFGYILIKFKIFKPKHSLNILVKWPQTHQRLFVLMILADKMIPVIRMIFRKFRSDPLNYGLNDE